MRQYDVAHPDAILIKLIVICSMFVLTCLLDLSFYKKKKKKNTTFLPQYISSWSVTKGGRPLFQIEVLAEVARPVLIACERMLSGGEGLFALKFNGFPLLLVLQPQEQSISGQGPMS